MTTIGAIADDLTGATDLAIVLTTAGFRTVVVPGEAVSGGLPSAADGTDAVVVALKSRTAPPAEAVAASLAALAALREHGCDRVLFKYCSTFDSTPDGNIGPVADALLDALGAPWTVVAPAFPANGRTVYRGHLFVGDDPLDESPMRDHPLTPMRDSSLPRLLAPQVRGGAGAVGLVGLPAVTAGPAALRAALDERAAAGARHLVVDAVRDADLVTLVEATADLPLLTGGSAVAQGLTGPHAAAEAAVPAAGDGPRVVLSGSASQATRAQVRAGAAAGAGIRLDPVALRRDPSGTHRAVAGQVLAHPPADGPVVVYATGDDGDLSGPEDAPLFEEALGAVARLLVEHGVRRLVVAGGETSGAVVAALGVRGLVVGPRLDPGVAWARAERGDGEEPLGLVLKSGNFGGPDLFVRAWDAAPDGAA
ncbi:3-oxo-tetronate kinase [Pseudonocardia sp. ICBG1293]|uniref:3-oxo-tetronate kinase n=1 Tax=Pseudonocardia sp. ICBG1293 TaxID=2844382 RepID=UPI001CC98914|nr:3-oxo-tetronate kinase [Pseudonocardia sp. ICBG1293]